MMTSRQQSPLSMGHGHIGRTMKNPECLCVCELLMRVGDIYATAKTPILPEMAQHLSTTIKRFFFWFYRQT